MDFFSRGLSKKELSTFLSREYDGEYTTKKQEFSKAHSMELKRMQKILAKAEAKDDGSDFPSVKDQWKDKPETLREVEGKPQRVTESLSDITVPLAEIIRKVHTSYYTRSQRQWLFVMMRDVVELIEKERDKFEDSGDTQRRRSQLEALVDKPHMKDYVRD